VKEWNKSHKTIVLLEAKHEEELIGWERLLGTHDVVFETFSEPDIMDQKTALVTLPDDGGIFRKSKLASF
jgi:hypothetical protein